MRPALEIEPGFARLPVMPDAGAILRVGCVDAGGGPGPTGAMLVAAGALGAAGGATGVLNADSNILAIAEN